MSITRSAITSLKEAISFRQKVRESGKSFVLTNGCFDLLHCGHAYSLQEASKYGDHLWVAMNSDASVHKLKGTERPIIPEDQRAYLLDSLSCVSGVTLFENERLTQEILALEPDVYVKASDYTEDSINPEEKEALLSVNATLQFVPFLPGNSTSSLIKRIQSRSNKG
ncbi:adenylyltransferase/cytidyltransferase family protein [Verrucomicrobia bacterium]|nr:adenylyltransferase/cytidyltransferase family protein [Verrucomicrobiota bacterium]